MNTTNCCSDSTINEIISIFKEIDMEVNIIKIEKSETKFGVKKVLTAEDGTTYKISSKQKFYDSIVSTGMYELKMDEYQGHPFVAWATFKGGYNQLSGASNPALPTTKKVDSKSYEDKLKADKERQNDIRLEFYCNLAKDIAIANKKDGVDVSYEEVQEIGRKMYYKHLVILGIMKAEEKKDIAVEPPAQTLDSFEGEPPF